MKQKYNYDIKIIQEGENDGKSVRQVARENGWNELNTQQWIKRNFKRIVRYLKK